MSTEENKKVVLRWIEQAWEKRDVDIIDELHAPDYVGHIVGTPGPVQGREAFKQLFASYLAAFDLHRTNEFLIAEGDKVVAYDTYRDRAAGRPQPAGSGGGGNTVGTRMLQVRGCG